MIYRLLADITFVVHLTFIVFVVFGGLLVAFRGRIAWLHVPALVWGILLEWQSWVCPLTPLENWFLRQAGETAYSGGFIERYLIPIIYPDKLDPGMQRVLGASLLLFNVVVYAWVVRRYRLRIGKQERPNPNSDYR